MRRLSVVRLIRSSYLLYFAQPAADRVLYRAVQRQPIRAIVEIGVGLGDAAGRRTERILEIAGWRRDCLPLAYTGIDLFESRPECEPRLALKDAFGGLRATGAKTRLVPGDPYSAPSADGQRAFKHRPGGDLSRGRSRLSGTSVAVRPADDSRPDADPSAGHWHNGWQNDLATGQARRSAEARRGRKSRLRRAA